MTTELRARNESWQLSLQRARKPHVCLSTASEGPQGCGRWIVPGEVYMRLFGIYAEGDEEGGAQREIFCAECASKAHPEDLELVEVEEEA